MKPFAGARGGRWRVALLISVAACNAAKDCADQGCRAVVLIHPPPSVANLSAGTLTVCIDGQCDDRPFNDRFVEVPAEGMEEGDQVTAVLVMPDGARYEDEIEASTTRPNGPGCSPVCIDAELTLG